MIFDDHWVSNLFHLLEVVKKYLNVWKHATESDLPAFLSVCFFSLYKKLASKGLVNLLIRQKVITTWDKK
jgi:hypothetical protein